MKRYTALLAVCLAVPSLALAGGTATIKTTSTAGHFGGMKTDKSTATMRFDWRDAHTARIDGGDGSGYMIFREGKGYMVSRQDGQTVVVDMAGFGNRGRAMAKESPSAMYSGMQSVQAIDGTATVGGVSGSNYRMTWTDDRGQTHTADAVLTDDPLVVDFTRAYFGTMALLGATDAQKRSFMDSLPGDKRGVLKFGDSFEITRISDTAAPASRYELPAEPVTMQQMFQGAGQH